jgi:hypothetical protein
MLHWASHGPPFTVMLGRTQAESCAMVTPVRVLMSNLPAKAPLSPLSLRITICALTSSLLVSRCASEKEGFGIRTRLGVGRSRAVRTLEFDSPACARYVNKSPVSLQEAYAPSIRLLSRNPIMSFSMSQVSEEDKLECCCNALNTQCHYPKRPSVIKRTTSTHIE